MKQKKISQNGRQVLTFITDCTNDYIAARTLLISGLLQQGAILGSTAIEKACKAILAFHGNESRGHLKKAHWNAVKHFDKELWSGLRQDFLDLAKKAYSLRYTDDLAVNFNIVLAQREFLAELDHTIILLVQGFNFAEQERGKGTKLLHLIKRRDPQLLIENHVFSKTPKEQFILQTPQKIYEMRYVPQIGPMESEYFSNRPAKVPTFTRQGNIYHKEGMTHNFELSHFPMPPTSG